MVTQRSASKDVALPVLEAMGSRRCIEVSKGRDGCQHGRSGSRTHSGGNGVRILVVADVLGGEEIREEWGWGSCQLWMRGTEVMRVQEATGLDVGSEISGRAWSAQAGRDSGRVKSSTMSMKGLSVHAELGGPNGVDGKDSHLNEDALDHVGGLVGGLVKT